MKQKLLLPSCSRECITNINKAELIIERLIECFVNKFDDDEARLLSCFTTGD